MKELDNFGIDKKLTTMPDDVAETISGLTPELIEQIRHEYDFGGFATLPADEARLIARLISYLPHDAAPEAA